MVQLIISSRTQPGKKHIITVDTLRHRVSCDCKGFFYNKRCEHIKFYSKTIKNILEKNGKWRTAQ